MELLTGRMSKRKGQRWELDAIASARKISGDQMKSGPRPQTGVDGAEGFHALEKAPQPVAFLGRKRKIAELKPARVAYGEGSFLGFVFVCFELYFAENEVCLCSARVTRTGTAAIRKISHNFSRCLAGLLRVRWRAAGIPRRQCGTSRAE